MHVGFKRLLGLLLLGWHLTGAAQSFSVSATCRTNIFFSADIPGLIGDWPCAPVELVNTPGTFGTSASGGSDRLGGSAQATVRGGFGNLGAAVGWSAHAVQGAAAATFSVVSRARAQVSDVLSVGGVAGSGYIPIEVRVELAWDSGRSGNDLRERNAWLLESTLDLGFGSANGAGGLSPAAALAMQGCNATANWFPVLGPAFEATCTQRDDGPHRVVVQGTYLALPQSQNVLTYTLQASGNFGGVLGTVLASDGALSAGGFLASLNSMTVSVSTPTPGVALSFASGASYAAPVPEPGTAALGLLGLAGLWGLGLARRLRRRSRAAGRIA